MVCLTVKLGSARPLTITWILSHVISGVLNWNVHHSRGKVCALKHSTVDLSCKYTTDKGHKVTAAFWFLKETSGQEPADILLDPRFQGRMEYLGDKEQDCGLRISDARESDSATYDFLFKTSVNEKSQTSESGVQVTVTDLDVQVLSMENDIAEGDWLILSCGSCIPTSFIPTYIWKKDGRPHATKQGNNILEMESVKMEDGGEYSCLVRGHERANSPFVIITVKCRPRLRVQVSRDRVTEGDSIALRCNATCSQSATPVYTWRRDGQLASPISTNQSILFLNSVSHDDAGSYTCAEQGHEHLPSPALILQVRYAPKKTTVSVSPSGEIVEGSSVTLTCSSDANPPATYTWFKENVTSPVGSEQTYGVSELKSEDAGLLYCVAQNDVGNQSSLPFPLVVKSYSGMHWAAQTGLALAVVVVSVLFAIGLWFLLKRRNQETTDANEAVQRVGMKGDETYMALDLSTKSSDYETLGNVRRACSNVYTSDPDLTPDYEHIG